MFVLFLNMLGMMPYSFTVTSHIAVTFALAFLIFLLVTIVGFVKHGFGFFGYFAPKGVPVFMLPLLVVIEVISYFTRPISLSVRLFANMMAGHTMLKIILRFCTFSRFCRWMVTTRCNGCVYRLRNFNCFFTSICFYNFNLYLFE